MLTANEIRRQFIEFFKERDHRFIRSSPVIPFDDPTLLFTNAGMNQFKGIFLGVEQPPHPRAVNSQKCIRVSGKHNDLEEVGKDGYHHTFFEMLGNWSFGDYYKREAIQWAWELFTQVWGIPKDKLYATVYEEDDEAYRLWGEVTDINPRHILRFGKKDNFWEMGETGPCGPCSELHVDLGGPEPIDGTDPERGVNSGNSRFIELWNLVFIQYNHLPDGTFQELPHKHVDTGAGLERITAYLQGHLSNYATDLFQPIIKVIEEFSGVPYAEDDTGTPHRVIADHVRMLTFAITDGALPSNDGRGYVLRRILRRAARFGRKLELKRPFIYELVPVVVELMGEAYPELKNRVEYVQRVIKAEEESFAGTLDRGLQIFSKMVKQAQQEQRQSLTGEEVFTLYDTYGFPADLTRLMAEEQGLSVDEAGFQHLMKQQREKARAAHRFRMETVDGGEWVEIREGPHSHFIGYDFLDADVHVVRYKPLDEEHCLVVLDQTPFYAESGGQVGDKGVLFQGDKQFPVVDTQKEGDAIVHQVRIRPAELNGETYVARVDAQRRAATVLNHSATHLLQAALREILGEHVKQAGSLVAPDYLRFDFNHFEKLRPEEIRRVEERVNELIRKNVPAQIVVKSFDEAAKEGALAFFGEKYGDEVRTVRFGPYSYELCGGTHVKATGDIGYFRIVQESAIAAGVRRIMAVTGATAVSQARQETEQLTEAAEVLKTEPARLTDKLKQLLEERRRLEKELQRLQFKLNADFLEQLAKEADKVDDIAVVSTFLNARDMEELKSAADALMEHMGSGVGVLGAEINERPYLVCVVSEDVIARYKLKAGDLVRELGRRLGGGGGGKPHLATAGGKELSRLDEVLAGVKELVAQRIRHD